MNKLEELLSMPENEMQARGVFYTPREIMQQPQMWEQTLAVLLERRSSLMSFLSTAGATAGNHTTLLLMGAGTSEYIGSAVADTLRSRLGLSVEVVPTTSFVTHADELLVRGAPYLFVSFARSGESPESIGSFMHARALRADAYHLIITSNKEGRLAVAPRTHERTFVLELPEPTNDRSLVMTSSFSSMTLAAIALGYLDDLTLLEQGVSAAAGAVRNLLKNEVSAIDGFSRLPGDRIQFLGTGRLFGAMRECRLKVLEMTAGKIAANVDTYLGLRHGPQVFVNDSCSVVASLSEEPYRRQYELDLLAELRAKHQGSGLLLICGERSEGTDDLGATTIRLSPGTGLGPVPAPFRVLTDVVVGQLIGLFKSLALGLKPDNPSETGIISRVVAGVRVYPLPDPPGEAPSGTDPRSDR